MAPPPGGVIFRPDDSTGEIDLTAEQRYALARLGPDRFWRWVQVGRQSVSPR